MSYKSKLDSLIELYVFEPRDDTTLQAIEYHLKSVYPGKYKLQWADPLLTNVIDTVWDNTEDEIIFKLKWS